MSAQKHFVVKIVVLDCAVGGDFPRKCYAKPSPFLSAFSPRFEFGQFQRRTRKQKRQAEIVPQGIAAKEKHVAGIPPQISAEIAEGNTRVIPFQKERGRRRSDSDRLLFENPDLARSAKWG